MFVFICVCPLLNSKDFCNLFLSNKQCCTKTIYKILRDRKLLSRNERLTSQLYVR